MKYLSVCSGIEAATSAWHNLGWEPVAFSEIEPFPSAVLKHHYPDVPNLGDMTKFQEWNLDPIDLLVGGTPCQSFSVAGLRKGLDDPRGNLMLTYGAIAKRFRPKWLVWENVPGVLSSNEGRDFATFLGMLAELGYGFAYRVLDAQYFGVAQRRRRVFVVGCLGDWRAAAAVLFERTSLCRDIAPSREKRQDPAKCLTTGVGKRYDAETDTMIPVGVPEVTATLLSSTAGISRTGNAVTEHETYIPMAPIPLNSMTMQGRPSDDGRMGSGIGEPGDPCPTITKAHSHAVATNMAVRRLTPVECERLQGFPDNYTAIPWRGKEAPDGPRYKALGNSMAVPVMAWIGKRIGEVNELQK